MLRQFFVTTDHDEILGAGLASLCNNEKEVFHQVDQLGQTRKLNYKLF